MKKIIHFFVLLIITKYSFAQTGNVGIGTPSPNASSALDITDNSRGILIPRVALTATNAASPITSPETSLLVYNTATAGSAPNNVTPGYYYNAGTPASPNWVRLQTKADNNWTVANTTSTPAIKTDNQYVTGNVGIGDFSSSSPANKIHVVNNVDGQGVAALDNSTAGGFAGLYFYQGGNSNYRGHIGYVNSGGASSFGGKGTYQLASGNRPLVFSATNGSELFNEVARFNNTNGNFGVGTSTIPNESKFVIGALDATNEGGQLQINAPGGSYTTAYFLDNYQNNLRFLSGTNTGTSATRMTLDNNGNFGINIAPTAKLHSYTNTASKNAIQGENYGTTNGTDWSSSGNFAGVTGYGGSGSTQYQAGVFGYQLGSGANSGGVVGAYSSSTYGALGYTDNNSNTWGNYNLGGKGSYTGENIVTGRGITSGKIQMKQGPNTGTDNQYHTVQLDANYAGSSISAYATGSYMDGDIKMQGIDITGLLTTTNTWYYSNSSFASSSSTTINTNIGATCDNCTHTCNCPDGSIATGWQVYAASQLDTYLKLRCTALASGFNTVETGYGIESVYNFPNANADNFTHVGVCPTGTFIKGMAINTGSYLDTNLRVFCTGIKKN